MEAGSDKHADGAPDGEPGRKDMNQEKFREIIRGIDPKSGAAALHELIQRLAENQYTVIPDTNALQPANKDSLDRLLNDPVSQGAGRFLEPYSDGLKNALSGPQVVRLPEVAYELTGLETHVRSRGDRLYENPDAVLKLSADDLCELSGSEFNRFMSRDRKTGRSDWMPGQEDNYLENKEEYLLTVRSIQETGQIVRNGPPEMQNPLLYELAKDFVSAVSKARKPTMPMENGNSKTDESLISMALYCSLAEKESAIVTTDRDLGSIFLSAAAYLRKSGQDALAEPLERSPATVIFPGDSEFEMLSTSPDAPLSRDIYSFASPETLDARDESLSLKALVVAEARNHYAPAR